MDKQVNERSRIQDAVEAIEQTAMSGQKLAGILDPYVTLYHGFDKVAKSTCDTDNCGEQEHENQFEFWVEVVDRHRKN